MDDKDSLLDEQLAYYDQRAPIYDDAYTRTGHSDRGPEANARWWSELRTVEAALDRVPIAGNVLELGCGTGRWTERLADRAASLTALDGSARMLALARARLQAARHVSFDRVDILRGWSPDRDFDLVAAFFFLEHVPDQYIDRVVSRISVALRPGGRVFVAEGRHREPHSGVEIRDLHGQPFRVVERRRTEEEFRTLFARHGLQIDFGVTDRFFCYLEAAASP